MTVGRVLVIAHRGACGEAPENTLAAFERAIAAGADAIELDVHLTADGRLAVIHDDTVKRTTGARGKVAKMRFDDLAALDAGRWFGREFAGERIPALEEVVKLAAGRAGLFVEVKKPGRRRAEAAELVARALEAFDGEAVVESFDAKFVSLFKMTRPRARVALLTESRRGLEAARRAGADAVSVGLSLPASRRLLSKAKAEGFGLYVWTVRTFRTLAAALRWEIDGVITNYPRRARAVLERIDEAAAEDFGGAPREGEAYLLWRQKFLKKMRRWPAQA
jgi:glycerophosphoryl diester phosphodiesterase